MPRTPSLRLHATGQFCFCHQGKTHYVGRDKFAAEGAFRAYFGALEAATRFAASQAVAKGTVAYQVAPPAPKVKRRPTMSLREVAEARWVQVDANRTERTSVNEREMLRPFLDRYGRQPIDGLTPHDLIEYTGIWAKRKFNPLCSVQQRKPVVVADSVVWWTETNKVD